MFEFHFSFKLFDPVQNWIYSIFYWNCEVVAILECQQFYIDFIQAHSGLSSANWLVACFAESSPEMRGYRFLISASYPYPLKTIRILSVQTDKIVSEMTYNVSMGTLNPTIPYRSDIVNCYPYPIRIRCSNYQVK